MKIQTLLRGAALGASAAILFAGLALAQTAPAPAPAAPPPAAAPAPGMGPGPGMGANRAERRQAFQTLRNSCREKTGDLRGPERRESMRKCMSEGRAAAGLTNREERRAKMRDIRDACRTELKDQRFTEAERRAAMRDCAVKKDPSLAKGFACRDQAEAKKLEPRTPQFRDFMRQCHLGR